MTDRDKEFLRRTALTYAMRARNGDIVENARRIFTYLADAEGDQARETRIRAVEAAADAYSQNSDLVAAAVRIEAFLSGKDAPEFAPPAAKRMQPGDVKWIS